MNIEEATDASFPPDGFKPCEMCVAERHGLCEECRVRFEAMVRSQAQKRVDIRRKMRQLLVDHGMDPNQALDALKRSR